MALQDLLGGMMYPVPSRTNVALYSYGAISMDASGEKIAYRIPIQKSGTIDKIGFKFSATQTPTAVNGIKVSLQASDLATGTPTGTILAYRNVTSGLALDGWLETGKITSDGTDGGSQVDVTRGQILFVVFEFISFQSGDRVDLQTLAGSPYQNLYYGLFQSSTWSKLVSSGAPIVSVKYTDGTYPLLVGGLYPVKALTTHTFNNTSSPDEIGSAFSFPTRILIGGVIVRVDLDGDAEVRLYNESLQLVASKTLDKDEKQSINGGEFFVMFDSDVQYPGNEQWIMSIAPTSATNISIASYDVDQAEMLDLTDGGSAWRFVSRADSGDWTFNNLRRAWFSLWVTGTDHEVGGQPSAGFEGTL